MAVKAEIIRPKNGDLLGVGTNRVVGLAWAGALLPGSALGATPVPPADIALRYDRVARAVLLDSAARWSEGERRDPIEWTAAAAIVQQLAARPASPRVILSAGLTPESVARAIEVVKPYAVDVNSGVEATPGRKDPDKVWRFVAEAKGVR